MLVTRVGTVICGLPIEHVVETMRPLAVEPLARSADPSLAMIDGVATIRGEPVPVVDVRKLLGVPGEPAARFVVVRAGARRVALAVDAVLDVRTMALGAAAQLPRLLDAANRDCVSAIAARDADLLVVLDATRLVPEASWHVLQGSAERSDIR